MKLKGDLDSIGVAELFKTLADQRATGVLTVNSPMGDKTVALSMGEIAIATDTLSERTRLGDVLVARGRLTESQLGEALKAQKLNPRAKLGDLMVKQGLITQDIISEAVKFQVEEQIFDLYSWKEAQFEFDSDKSVEDVFDPDGSGNPVQRLSISVAPLVQDAVKRQENWKHIQARIPTPYLCFKLTPKGEELVSKAPRNTQTIVKLLKEGRTLETTIKRSCIGRFNVCNAVVKMLDDGWIMPTSAAELRFLASEHRFKKRFLDALYIYRRLLESASSDTDKAELERSIQDTIEAIHSANAAGEVPEGVEIVSFKAAAARFKRRQKARRIALAIFGATALIVVPILLFQLAPKPPLPEDYKKAIDNSAVALDKKDYDAAIKIWNDFYQGLADKGGDLANWSRDRLSAVISKQKTFLKEIYKKAADLETAGKLEEAKDAYKEYAEKYPKSEDAATARDGIVRIDKTIEDQAKQGVAQKQKRETDAALAFFTKKEYSNARTALEKVSHTLPPDSDLLKQVRAAQKQLQEIEDRVSSLKTTADSELRENKGEKAIQDYDEATKEWPDLAVADEARNAGQKLKVRLELLKKEMNRAKEVQAAGGDQAAQDVYNQARHDFPEFELIREIDKLLEPIKANVAELDKLLAEAQAIAKSGDKAKSREKIRALMQKDFTYCANHDVRVWVEVKSFPDGASVKIDGKDAGITPVEIELPVSKQFVLHFERKGYEPTNKTMKGLTWRGPGNDLDGVSQPLKRTHLFKLQLESADLKAAGHNSGIFAPPVVIDGKLYVLHGNSLTLLDPLKGKELGKIESIFQWNEPSMKTRIDGTGAEKMVDESMNWWFPRAAPAKFKDNKMLITSRTRELIEVDVAAMRARKLISLPAEPIGQPCIDQVSMRLGHPLAIVGCADGKVYVYDLEEVSEKPVWPGAMVDPDKKVLLNTGYLATGAVSRQGHAFLALSSSGLLKCFASIDGQSKWPAAMKLLNGDLEDGNSLPFAESDNLAAFVHKDGNVTAIDLKEQQVLWIREAARQNDKAKFAAVNGDSIYVVTIDGNVYLYNREAIGNKPKQQKIRNITEDPSDVPILATKKAIFIVLKENPSTKEHKITALSPDDLHELWFYRTEHKPSAISFHENMLYIGTEDGTLLILSTD